MTQISLAKTFQGKHFLITGATGFMGSVLFSMLLHDFENIGKVYLLIRSKQRSSEERLREMLSSPVFIPLKEKYGDKLDAFIQHKLILIEGDVVSPDLGLTESQYDELKEKVDLVIHCAGNVSMTGSIEELLDPNVFGILNIIRFIRSSHAKLVHISTAYVVGNKSGVYEEKELDDIAPNGEKYDTESLLKDDYQLIAETMKSHPHLKENALKKKLAKKGLDKVNKWGWPNIYTYSKTMAERLLTRYLTKEQLTIVRPSIIESSLTYPFTGWNVGYNTSAPIVYLVGTWYPFLAIKREVNLDIIPVDYVCRMTLIAAAALLLNQHQAYYHATSSGVNPLTLYEATSISRIWWRSHLEKYGKNWFQRKLSTKTNLIYITPFNIFYPEKLRVPFKKLRDFLDRLETKLPEPFKKLFLPFIGLFRRTDYNLKKWAETYNVYLPYIFDYQYVFENKNLDKIQVEEIAYQVDIKSLNWEQYWFQVHLPGLQKWCSQLTKD